MNKLNKSELKHMPIGRWISLNSRVPERLRTNRGTLVYLKLIGLIKTTVFFENEYGIELICCLKCS